MISNQNLKEFRRLFMINNKWSKYCFSKNNKYFNMKIQQRSKNSKQPKKNKKYN